MAMTLEAESQPITKKAKITFGVVGGLALLFFIYGIYWWWSGRNFRTLVAMAQEEMNFETMSKEDMKSRFDQYRQLSKGLTEGQRQQLNDIREQQQEKREMQKYNNFFAMSKKDQNDAIDKEIQRGEKMRKEWEQKRQQFQKQNGGNNGQPKVGQGGGGKGGPAGGGGRGGASGGKSSPEQRNKSAANRLDRSSPEFRLAREEYRKRTEERRAQMGLPPGGGRGPGGGGGGRPGGGGGGAGGKGGGGGGGKRG